MQKFIVAKEQLDQGNPEGMKVWVNTELGETWEERGEQVEDTELFNRREIYDAVVPEEVLVLTAGVDVQDDRFEVEIVGWGVGKESWGIRYQKIYGDKYKKVKKNKSASRAPAGESIEQRPEEIDEREEFGHWEGDTVYSGKGKRKTTRALLTLTERKTRKEIIIAIPNRKAETVVKALDALERKLGARRFRAIFKSITFDNGTEFAAAEELERSCVNKRLPRTKVYFCHPYSSWERGTNENTNGMIRRRFPKGTNFAAVTNAQIAQAENWINNYPRKILGYKSSEIVFRECLRELGIAA